MLVTKLAQLPRLTDAKSLGYDLETSDPNLEAKGPGVRRKDGEIIGIALSAPGRKSWYLPLVAGDGVVLPREAVVKYLRDLVAKPREWVGANLDYDLDWASGDGIYWPREATYFDVLHAHRLCEMQAWYPNLDTVLRENLGLAKTGEELWTWLATHRGKGEPTLKAQIKHLREAPAHLVAEYAEGDVVELHALKEKLTARMKELHAYDWFLVEQRLLPVVLRIEQRGIRVDVKRAEELKEELDARYETALNKLGSIVFKKLWKKLTPTERLEQFSAQMTKPLAEAYAERGVEVPRTQRGNPSITKEWLAEQGDDFSKLVRECRHLSTLNGSFVQGSVLEHHVNGRLHGRYKQLGPRTLRFASENPNMQQVPARDEEIAPLIRGLYLPEEGHDYLRTDYSQEEYRLLCHFAQGRGAQEARDAYARDKTTDFHELLRGWLQDKGVELSRKTIKNANFAKAYRAGKEKFAATLGVSFTEGAEIFDKYDELLPFVKYTAKCAEDVARDRGYLNLLLGDFRMHFMRWEVADWDLRKHDEYRTYPSRAEALARVGPLISLAVEKGEPVIRPRSGAQRADLYKALNRLIQPSAGQIMKQGMLDLYDAGIDDVCPMLLTVHDELGLSVPCTRAGREAAVEARRILERVDRGASRVPLYVGFEVGPDWGHTEEVEDTSAWIAEVSSTKKVTLNKKRTR